jgi:hypothetical protein
MTESAIPLMFRAGETVAQSRSAETVHPTLPIVGDAKVISLRALVRQVYPSYRWENACWITLGSASLLLLVLSLLV